MSWMPAREIASECRSILRRRGRTAHGCVVVVLLGLARQTLCAQQLPDAPSTAMLRLSASLSERALEAPEATGLYAPAPSAEPGMEADQFWLPPCNDQQLAAMSARARSGDTAALAGPGCRDESKLQSFVNSKSAPRLNSREKGRLAVHDIVDPFNLITIVGYAAISSAANAHSAYGPGFKGFGRLVGYSLLQDAQGEFIGTYVIPSLVHQDPRYHRMSGSPIPRRVLHALAHTVVTSHDDGSAMPNYATLLTYPLSAELSNLYVPGVQTDSVSTWKRIGVGLATDPAGALLAEFLPDIARRIHIRVIFVQQILNQVAVGAPNTF